MESKAETEVAEVGFVSPYPPTLSDPYETRFSLAYAVAVAFAVGSAVVVAILPEPRPQGWVSYAILAILFGSVFGHTTSASIWASLGTGAYWARLLMLLGWLLTQMIAMTIMVSRTGGGPPGEMAFVVSGTMLVQSVFIQIPLWILRLTLGLQLAVRQTLPGEEPARMQFGIGHMMAFTATIAGMLGAAQAVIRVLNATNGGTGSEWGLFLYLAAGAILASLPVAAAALLDRRPIAAMLLALVFVAASTATEHPLMVSLGLTRGGPDIYHVITINMAVALIVLVYCLGLRAFGFRLTVGKTAKNPMVNVSPF